MVKSNKKSAKKASETFYNIIKASVTPPAKAITPPETPKKKAKKKVDQSCLILCDARETHGGQSIFHFLHYHIIDLLRNKVRCHIKIKVF